MSFVDKMLTPQAIDFEDFLISTNLKGLRTLDFQNTHIPHSSP